MSRSRMVLVLAQLLACACCAAQKNSSELIGAEPYTVELPGSDAVLKKLPFNSIRLVDSRFDSSKVGYVKKNGSYRKLVLDAGLRETVQAYLQRRYATALDAASPYSLVLVVKHLWLQESSEAEQEHRKIERTSEATTAFGSCTAVCEAYFSIGDTYIPLFQLDSSYTENSPLKKCAGRLLLAPLEDCVAKASGMNLLKMAQAKRKLSWSDVESYNAERLHYPHFSTGVPERGIYKTFADFLQNKPVAQAFQIEFGAHTDEVFVMQGGKPALLTDYWGVSDGEKIFVRIGYGLFEMAKQNNAYDVWGSKLSIYKYHRFTPGSVSSPAQAIVGSALFNRNRVVTNAKPLQLNMETGTVY